MDIKDIVLKTAYTVDQFPKSYFPELVIGGRSNVGKSSLINKLLGIKRIAHVSSKPGKTESINFYHFNKKTLLVDLPGYGYAKRSKRTLSYWGNIIESYLSNRANIKLMLVLVDVRRGLQKEELDLMSFLSYLKKDFFLVFTKVDKLSKNDVVKFKRDIDFYIAKEFRGQDDLFNYFKGSFFVSSTKNTGVLDLKRTMEKY